jgi:hypothetical protein
MPGSGFRQCGFPFLLPSSTASVLTTTAYLKVKVTLRPTISRPVCPGVKPHAGLNTTFLLLSDSCAFVDVVRPL